MFFCPLWLKLLLAVNLGFYLQFIVGKTGINQVSIIFKISSTVHVYTKMYILRLRSVFAIFFLKETDLFVERAYKVLCPI